MERKTGEFITAHGIIYQCVESPACTGCAMLLSEPPWCIREDCIFMQCSEHYRSDGRPVAFKFIRELTDDEMSRYNNGDTIPPSDI